ncbi:hypothetical protein AB2M62_01040 [Sphingomonas sp. MMS12-HWE2-04]|uniref:hypothetical protein n=1 Tax=Sphingomonas sp. MMS12-HWE2-04 TaxID=3234199 RepID=UPI00384ACB1A
MATRTDSKPRTKRAAGTKAATTAKPRAPRRAKAAPAKTRSRGSAFGAVSIGAAVSVLAAGAYGLYQLIRRMPRDGEHVPTDLYTDAHPDGSERAPVDFRPDPTAAVPASERDQFRPALAGGQAPTLVCGQAQEPERLNAAQS